MKRVLTLLIIFLMLFILVSCLNPSEEQEAKKLYKDARKLVDVAERIEKHSVIDAFQLYKNAVENIEEIILTYSSTDLAINLASDNTKIGPFTFTQLKSELLPEIKKEADQEKSRRMLAKISEQELKVESSQY
ncbi:MAG: hypothetical protein KAX49_12280 [Halanaerobiales bacterium]|nr:hypothetical protein [Halanaerobiales bacterium]